MTDNKKICLTCGWVFEKMESKYAMIDDKEKTRSSYMCYSCYKRTSDKLNRVRDALRNN